jgi:hypothetical protein
MDRQQKRHERHEVERRRKQARQRQAQAAFARPGQPAIRPVWFVVGGLALAATVATLWIVAIW